MPIIASGTNPTLYGDLFDTISVCLSKRVGCTCRICPVRLSRSYKERGKRIRKVLGGTMRQAGYIASAGLFALRNNVDRLATDHQNARIISESLSRKDWVSSMLNVETNIIIFRIVPGIPASKVVEVLKQNEILCSATGPDSIRFVTHLDISAEMVDHAVSVIGKLERQSFSY
ncbi:MAG: beta-eliminating lyase-related protein [Bacteroidales bacterium]